MKKIPAIKAASGFVNKYFPESHGALLAGSVVRGQATATSDLDIIVFDKNIPDSYRESFIEFGWNIEVFVHNLHSYKQFFQSDVERARPSMPRMISEGVILKDDRFIEAIKREAKDLLAKGPEEWSKTVIDTKRYFITDVLDDFIGCNNREEDIFIANALAELVSEFVLRTNQKWIGTSKWVVRALNEYDEVFSQRFVSAFDSYYTTGDKELVIKLAEGVLEPYGGRLFKGFVLGKSK